ncbi:MAG: hypothetical protein IJY15_01905 [Thermoguttaceae bacterium]|nr:hypothetical protein [Thermoguttaceae bacterium]
MNNFPKFSSGRDFDGVFGTNFNVGKVGGNGEREAGDGRTSSFSDSSSAAPSSVEPFAFVELERKTSDFLDKIRTEARRIADETRLELDALRAEFQRAANVERAELERSAAEIAEARRRIDAEAAALDERRRTLEQETFEEARRAGFDAGLVAGKEEGARRAAEEAAATIAVEVERGVEEKTKAFCDAALEPLQKLTGEMAGVRRSLLKHWEENAMQIAAAIAYQTIMRDPAIKREVPLDLLREALELAMNCAALKIRMNPRDVETLKEPIRAILEETGNLATAEVVADPKIAAGGCVVESAHGVVDERLASRLERIVAELSE